MYSEYLRISWVLTTPGLIARQVNPSLFSATANVVD